MLVSNFGWTGGGGGGGTPTVIYFSVTKAQLDTLILGSTLVAGATYLINDRGDNGLIFTAVSSNEIAQDGTRRMLCPATYMTVVDIFGNDWIGVWNITKAVVVGQLSIWGGLVGQNTSGHIGLSIDDITLSDSDWVLIPKDSYANNEYTQIEFSVSYDYINDWIFSQWDTNGNKLGMPFSLSGESTTNYCSMSDWNANTFTPFYNNICGGVFNNSNNDSIINNQVDGVISNNSNTGVIGYNDLSGDNNANSSSITNNSNTGNILSNMILGSISNNTNSSSITNNSNSGNILNNANNGVIQNNKNNGLISANTNNVTAIANNTNNGSITSNFSVGLITSNSCNGNIIFNQNVGDITNNINAGGVTLNGKNVTQIFSNRNNGVIDNNNNSGIISLNSNVGDISNNINSGDISSNSFNSSILSIAPSVGSFKNNYPDGSFDIVIPLVSLIVGMKHYFNCIFTQGAVISDLSIKGINLTDFGGSNTAVVNVGIETDDETYFSQLMTTVNLGSKSSAISNATTFTFRRIVVYATVNDIVSGSLIINVSVI